MTAPTKCEGALGKRFQGMAESIGPMYRHIFLPPGPSRFPSGGSRGIGHAGKNMSCPSSAMSSGRLFLDGALASVARLRFTGIISLKELPVERE
jgi:hypothetical protein